MMSGLQSIRSPALKAFSSNTVDRKKEIFSLKFGEILVCCLYTFSGYQGMRTAKNASLGNSLEMP
jgi:hypothetical protein